MMWLWRHEGHRYLTIRAFGRAFVFRLNSRENPDYDGLFSERYGHWPKVRFTRRLSVVCRKTER